MFCFIRKTVDEGTKLRHNKLEILKYHLISDPIHLALGRSIKRDLYTVQSKIQHLLHRRLASPDHKLLYNLLCTRDHILIRLHLRAQIIEEVLRALEGPYGHLSHYKAGRLDQSGEHGRIVMRATKALLRKSQDG
jgi:hypothetical protein